jgi:diguanylate cyclase (GGDEF)-like protein
MGFAFEYLVPLNLLLFALMFAGIYFYDRRARYAGWLAAAYASGTLAALLDIAQPHSPVARWDESDFSYFFYWGVGMLTFVSMASRFDVKLPTRRMAAMVLLGLCGQPIVGYFYYHHGWQELLNNGLLAGWLMMAARVVRQGSSARGHRLVSALFQVIAASCILRVVGIYVPGWLVGTDLVSLAETHNIAQLFLSGASANAAAMAMMAMAATDMVRHYRAEATVDPLTGLLNRRGLARALGDDERPGVLRGHKLLLIDLDHFKTVNDAHGHLAGDRVLQRVATLIRASVGTDRLIARMGGEEFAIVISPGDASLADALAVRLWVALREARHPELGGERVTASLGIGEIGDSDGFESAYARVDTALYRAKAAGRDRIIRAETVVAGRAAMI